MTTPGNQLRELRLAAGLSQSQLAAKIGLQQGDVSKLERDAGKTLPAKVRLLEEGVGVPTGTLVDLEFHASDKQPNMAAAITTRTEKRELAKAIEPYLDALEAGVGRKPTGRRTVEYLEQRILSLNEELAEPGLRPIRKVALLQEKLNLVREINERQAIAEVPIADLEAAFVEALPRYSQLAGITREAWRMIGVPAKVISAAYRADEG